MVHFAIRYAYFATLVLLRMEVQMYFVQLQHTEHRIAQATFVRRRVLGCFMGAETFVVAEGFLTDAALWSIVRILWVREREILCKYLLLTESRVTHHSFYVTLEDFQSRVCPHMLQQLC